MGVMALAAELNRYSTTPGYAASSTGARDPNVAVLTLMSSLEKVSNVCSGLTALTMQMRGLGDRLVGPRPTSPIGQEDTGGGPYVDALSGEVFRLEAAIIALNEEFQRIQNIV